jgi:arylsulfatase
LVYSFDNATAASRHTEQYYYIFGSRSIYKDGWKAAAAHHPDNVDLSAFQTKARPESNYDKDQWELYNLNEDFNERIDLAKKHPEKLAELKAFFDAAAKRYNIYPMIDWADVYDQKFINSKKAQNYKMPPPPPGKKQAVTLSENNQSLKTQNNKQ